MKRMKNIRLGTLVACMCVLWGCEKPNVNIVMPQEASNRVLFAGEHLKKALEDAGYSSVMLSDTAGIDKDEVCIRLEQATDTAGLKKEGFTISTRGNMTTVTGNDGNGVIYGCRELICVKKSIHTLFSSCLPGRGMADSVSRGDRFIL